MALMLNSICPGGVRQEFEKLTEKFLTIPKLA